MNEKLRKHIELVQNTSQLAQTAAELSQNANKLAQTLGDASKIASIVTQPFEHHELLQPFKVPMLSETVETFKTPIIFEAIESMKQLTETNQKLADSVRIGAQFSEIFANTMSEQIIAFQQSIDSMTQSIFNDFDWSSIRDGLRSQLEEYEIKLKEFDKELWTIDAELLDTFEDESREFNSSTIEKYVEDSLDSYIKFFMTDDLYSDYELIIEQAYKAYRNGDYALAVFPLFAVIDNLISNTFSAYQIDIQLKPYLRKHKDKIYHKVKDYVETNEDELAFYLMFFRRVFNVYKKMFEPSWNNHPKQINRNWIMHGSFTYNEITKVDTLKLFQLIKAIEVVKSISFEQDKQEVS
ncbi:hypothetical protein CON65_16590 [Bacillus pseudomycoides]|uniref:Uncharacterized protein n=1 Tax=Bacillus pseudomycoides TaxID=64104 RepID=A0AA91VAD8_9BACI|nr:MULTISPECIES: hypothetical protein [Bacillus]PEB54186.1 hypothetical protein COO03_06055 [Bacillus sp. AFS098217]PED81556.1 hypothetical protein CON65_16590 [Bacillus pseudomycoides]PEU14124.1 hypothetical protein CN525_18685 [Bacillus sp. AFS014408]PEU17393.1 hypothetical protein CN524_02395 [Bacillus sp. AFS019443]PFW62999.1 hypothetical protein COL20_10545 [Bacillus sp. AFS075034]